MMLPSSESNISSSSKTSRSLSALSWKEARTRLRESLEAYLQTDICSVRRSATYCPSDKTPWIISIWLKWDLDIIVGAFGSSIALLVIGCLGFVDETLSTFTRSQLIGAVLILLGCVLNAWLVSRYRLSASQGTDSLKRRMISRFLKEIQKQENDCMGGPLDVTNHDSNPLPTTSRGDTFLHHHDNGIDLVGTSLTAIYPVYRLHGQDDIMTGTTTILGGYWSRIPTLLLVQGDHIALQVGDTVPATCRVLEGKKSSTSFEVGQTITLESLGESVNAVKLPRGRSTLPAESSELLTLCNNMRIFEVLETPLEGFLRQPDHDSKPPQIFRQLNDVRGILSLVTVGVFVMTAVILLSRHDQFTSNLYYLLPSPFLAALGGFPFIGPACLIFIDALGTARILATYHPVASRLRSQQPAKEDPDKTNVDLLILRYTLATLASRLSLQGLGGTLDRWFRTWRCRQDRERPVSSLVHVPPASLNLLEKLGVATAFTLVDDELVCEPQAIPQQLLIPSGKGLKLLDLCPTYEDDSDDENFDNSDSSVEFKRNRQRSGDAELNNLDSDSDSDDDLKDHHAVPRRRQPRRRLLRKAFRVSVSKPNRSTTGEENLESESGDHEVQFEDPTWWQHLPSLKCIGLACLLVDHKDDSLGPSRFVSPFGGAPSTSQGRRLQLERCKTSLVQLICKERRSMQLRSLAQCIGFSSKPSSSGSRGDVSPFAERHRLYVFSSARVKERLRIDSHERSSEESRWWGFLRADSTSVIVQDARSGAYQLLTVGDPRVVTRMCHEAWQGENSTILPLAALDRETILETSDMWKLADLDVEAFSYAPIPHAFDTRIASEVNPKFYLVDNDPRGEIILPAQKDKGASAEWSLLQNQIFLGILGSLVIPRSEIQGLLRTLQDAGVRFVYFSPRNMRRQKEIASQMGIDVAWNCAISLRPLDQGEEDPHRMVSNYADWDVNAKLPHGVESVRRHLKDVDNVPLLVSLFTDVTKQTTMEMIEIFQEYHDTVIAVGLSHLPRNSTIFSSADLAIGVDVLGDCLPYTLPGRMTYNALLPSEVIFASAISAHFCAFRLRGVASIEHMPAILAQGRASLTAATSSAIFLLTGCLSFSLYALFSVCSVSTAVPYIPILGAFLYLQIILPVVGLPMAMSDLDHRGMQQVPPKNDASISFGKREGKTFYLVSFMKSLPPAVFPQLLYLIAFGELMIEYEPQFLELHCTSSFQPGDWASVVRCPGVSDFSGTARDSAVALSVGELILCVIATSASFVYRTLPIFEEPPWRRNHVWVASFVVGCIFLAVYLLLTVERGSFAFLPWYYFLLAVVMPVCCVAWDEYLKRWERQVLDRAEKLRRLQFETRLGMWSPK